MGVLYAKNKIYTGYDGNEIGFQEAASVSSSAFSKVNSGSFYLSYSSSLTIASRIFTSLTTCFAIQGFYHNFK